MIIVGAGEVGSYVAERLAREGHDVAVVEQDAARLDRVAEHLDVLTVRGSGTHPETMRLAGIEHADLVVAVTSSDETNLVVAQLATHRGVSQTVVRIEAPELRCTEARAFVASTGANLVIDPDAETAQEILELLEFPGASEVAIMGSGEVIVLGARLPEDAPLVGRLLSDVGRENEPDWDFMFGAVTRDGETVIPRGELRLEPNDLIRVVCKRRAVRSLAGLLGLERSLTRRALLLGGGRTAELLAARLDRQGVEVVIVERSEERARQIAAKLRGVLVLKGDITDTEILDEEAVGDFDAVVALTGDDDANVLSCLYAKSRGATETIAVIHRLGFLPILAEAGIDAAPSPRTACANGVLRFVRGGVSQVATFLEGEAEVLEFEVARGCPADGAIIRELRLPRDILIGAFVRDGKPQIARGGSTLRSRDHVVVFAMPSAVDEAHRVFS